MSNGRQVRSKFHVTILFQKIIFENTGDVVCYPEPKSEISQSNENDDQIYNIVQKHPEFPGGQKALYEYLKTNLVYPKAVQDSRIQGRVILSFVVEKDGSITNVKVIRGVLPTLDAEAIRVVSMMPKWKPGTQMGDTVRTKFTLPVLFKINQEESKK
jgi:TonB family protein